jgi:hypothetical protein
MRTIAGGGVAPRSRGLLSQVSGILSLWKHDRESNAFRGKTAWDIVAVWAGLQRVAAPPPAGSEHLRRLNEAVEADRRLLLDAVQSYRFDVEAWKERIQKIEASWDRSDQKAEELEWQTHLAFEELDRAQLFLWFEARFGRSEQPVPPLSGVAPIGTGNLSYSESGSGLRGSAWSDPLRKACEEAERFLAEQLDLFVCLSMDVSEVLACSPPDLEVSDPALWETLLKHRRIEEARDEAELAIPRREILARVPPGSSIATGAVKQRTEGSSSERRGQQTSRAPRHIDERDALSDCIFSALEKQRAMSSSDKHRWRESDDLVAFYLSRHSADQLGLSLSDVAEILSIRPGSMRMRMSNFQSQESPGGLRNASKQTCAVFQSYGDRSEPELRAMVLGILLRAREVG